MATITRALSVSAINPDDVLKYEETFHSFNKSTRDELNPDDIAKTWKAFQDIVSAGIKNTIQRESFMADCDYAKAKGNPLTVKNVTCLKQWSEAEKDPKIKRFEQVEQPIVLDDGVKDRLILAAQQARTHAYAPYSKFPVGAAILTEDGKIIHGNNVENAGYGSTICAERGAVMSTVNKINQGDSLVSKTITAIGLVLRTGGSPCGQCRQMLNEFNPDMKVIMGDIDGDITHEATIRELLPLGFGPENLK